MAQFPFCGRCVPLQHTARCLSQSADTRITFLHQQQRTSEGINWWGYAASLISHTRRVKPSSAIFALPIMFRSASAVFINCSPPTPRICQPKIFCARVAKTLAFPSRALLSTLAVTILPKVEKKKPDCMCINFLNKYTRNVRLSWETSNQIFTLNLNIYKLEINIKFYT